MSMPADEKKPFMDAKAVADLTRQEFVKAYKTKLAIAIKENWDSGLIPQKFKDKGFLDKPADPDFERYADELIKYKKIFGKPPQNEEEAKSNANAIPMEFMQAGITNNEESKNKLKKEFGTDQLNEIIFTPETLDKTANHLAATSARNRGYEALGGATLGNIIQGLFQWIGAMLTGLVQGTFDKAPTLEECIKKNTTQNMAGEADYRLKKYMPKMNENMRKLIVSEYETAAKEFAELIPKTKKQTIETTDFPKATPEPEKTTSKEPFSGEVETAVAKVNSDALSPVIAPLIGRLYTEAKPDELKQKTDEMTALIKGIIEDKNNAKAVIAAQTGKYDQLVEKITDGLLADTKAGPEIKTKLGITPESTEKETANAATRLKLGLYYTIATTNIDSIITVTGTSAGEEVDRTRASEKGKELPNITKMLSGFSAEDAIEAARKAARVLLPTGSSATELGIQLFNGFKTKTNTASRD